MQLDKIYYLKTFLILCGATAILSGCTSGITRTGYRLPSGQTSVAATNSPIAIKCNAHYSTNDVVLLGSIHAYDTGFSTRCDEAYVLGIFSEEGRMLGADVINITEERQPDFWSTCYQAKAQFLHFKDRKMAMEVYSDPKYAPDLVAERSNKSIQLEAAEAGGAIGGLIGGAIAVAIVTSESTPSHFADLQARAEKGDITAQRELGEDYDFGHEVRKNYKKAAKWYQLAANRGDAIAQNNLGSFYQYGLGVATNYNHAMNLYHQAADQGFMAAECNLGYMYDFGLGVSQDKMTSNIWYKKAADQNYPGAMLNLGYNYASGDGVQRNLPQAYMWLEAGLWLTQTGPDVDINVKVNSRIQDALDHLKSKMTPEEIENGEKLFKEWRGNYQKNRK